MTSDLELSKTVMNLSTLLVPVRDSGFRGMFDSKPWNISFQTSIILIHKVRAFGSNDLAAMYQLCTSLGFSNVNIHLQILMPHIMIFRIPVCVYACMHVRGDAHHNGACFLEIVYSHTHTQGHTQGHTHGHTHTHTHTHTLTHTHTIHTRTHTRTYTRAHTHAHMQSMCVT